MPRRTVIVFSAAFATLLGVAWLAASAPVAHAAGVTCAKTTDPSTSSSPGNPCWTDVQPYPFGSDGSAVDPSLEQCNGTASPCDLTLTLQVTSMAFRAWNRGLAATAAATFAGTPQSTNGAPGAGAFAVWLFNGANWFPDPTFPGSASCPGTTVLWAGKLDYWLIGGSDAASQQTLCRFDGVNLVWEELSLPAATRARLPLNPLTGRPVGGITAGACFAWNSCSFFGTDGIQVHWDGQVLSDASSGVGTSAWLQGDFGAAVARTDAAGNPFGLAVSATGATNASQPPPQNPVPPQPDGSPPPQVFASQGGPFSPLPFSPPATPQPGNPFTTDLVAVDADSHGDAWVAGDPTTRESQQQAQQAQPAPLLRLTNGGAAAPCPGYDGNTFASSTYPFPPAGAYRWASLSVLAADGSALAGAEYFANGAPEPKYQGWPYDDEPTLVRAACGQPPSMTRFRVPDPFYSDPSTAPLVPADLEGHTTAVAANASNDAWAATTAGGLGYPIGADVFQTQYQPPHLYRWSDGQPPAAPAGDDIEPRPSLFTLDAPVYVQAPPAVVVLPTTTTTTTTPTQSKSVKLKPAVYAVSSRLRPASGGKFKLTITFKLRRPVMLGVQALRAKQVVASTRVRRFTGSSGQLALTIDRKRWPTKIRFVSPTPKPTPSTGLIPTP